MRNILRNNIPYYIRVYKKHGRIIGIHNFLYEELYLPFIKGPINKVKRKYGWKIRYKYKRIIQRYLKSSRSK